MIEEKQMEEGMRLRDDLDEIEVGLSDGRNRPVPRNELDCEKIDLGLGQSRKGNSRWVRRTRS